jgi:hypothetical protein
MEPFDIDKIIKAKLEESHDLHQKEIEAAKPFVWSAVQKKIGTKHELRWFHLAAAVILLLISFSFALLNIQEKHRKELAAVNEKMNALEKNYRSRIQIAETKDAQVKILEENMKQLESKLTGLTPQTSFIEREKIIYRTDTVYIPRTEYITKVINPTEQTIAAEETIVPQQESTQPALAQNTETDDVIFLGYRNQNNTQSSETVKLKIGSFVSNKN